MCCQKCREKQTLISSGGTTYWVISQWGNVVVLSKMKPRNSLPFCNRKDNKFTKKGKQYGN